MAINWLGRGCESKKGWWITKEDELLRLDDMSTYHLKNAISYIYKYGGALRDFEHDKIDELKEELVKRNELSV